MNNYITNNNTVNEYISIYTNDLSSNLHNYTCLLYTSDAADE